MAGRALFDRLCEELERGTELARLAARGAVRLALREGGLEADTLTPRQVEAILRHLLPAELRKCGVAEPEAVCAALGARLAADAPAPDVAAPEDMFRRIRGR
jgi:hypothetical protein